MVSRIGAAPTDLEIKLRRITAARVIGDTRFLYRLVGIIGTMDMIAVITTAKLRVEG